MTPIPAHQTPGQCRQCGARLAPGAQWCSLCHTPTAAPQQSAPQQSAPRQSPPQANSAISIPAARRPSEAPLLPPPDPATAVYPAAADGVDPDQWVQMLAREEGGNRSRLSQILSRRATRIGVALAGAVLVMVLITATMLLLSVLAG